MALLATTPHAGARSRSSPERGWPDPPPYVTMGACRDIEARPPAWAGARHRRGPGAGDAGPPEPACCAGTAAVRSALITACGLVALFTPLALWVAWSPWMYWLVIACGCAALVIIYLVLEHSRDEFF